MRIFRDTIEDIVLKTDMVHHHDMVKEVTNECRALGITGPAVLDAYDEKWKMSVLAMIVHAADISNTCRQAQPAGEWARRVTEGALPGLDGVLAWCCKRGRPSMAALASDSPDASLL